MMMAFVRRDAYPAAAALAVFLAAPSGWCAEPPSPPPAQEEEAPPGSDEPAPPSLDDLLGLPEDEAARSAEEAARRDAREALDRELAEKRITDAMELALQKMNLSAELLERKLDSGLGTQRVQEEILAKLDELIDQAKNLQSMSKSSKPGQGQRSKQQQQQPPGQRPQQPDSTQQRSPQSSESNSIDPPPPQEGDINRIIDESRSEWGHLPPRVREMIEQWGQSKASKLYEDLTNEYYKRLAEDG